MQNQMIKITVETTINTTIGTVWHLWTTPDNIIQWNFPSADWHTTKVEIDLKNGGKFFFRMEMKNGNAGFDHYRIYDTIIPMNLLNTQYLTEENQKLRLTAKAMQQI